MDVVGLGFTSLDYIGLVPELPSLDIGVPLLDISQQGGGPVAQALVTLARLGASVGFVGRVGDDNPGRLMCVALRDEGVDIHQVQVEIGATSGQCIILVDQATGKRSICAHRGSVSDISVASLDLAYLCSGRFLHLDGHSRDAAHVAARAARNAGVEVCLDAGGPHPGLFDLVRMTDVLIAGERFAESYGDGCAWRGADQLLTLGPRLVVVTCGERGCLTVTTQDRFHTPSFTVPVVDTTGAGDVFHGAYLFGLCQGWNYQVIAEFASATAAIKCTRLGGRAGIPTFDRVMEFLAEHGSQRDALWARR